MKLKCASVALQFGAVSDKNWPAGNHSSPRPQTNVTAFPRRYSPAAKTIADKHASLQHTLHIDDCLYFFVRDSGGTQTITAIIIYDYYSTEEMIRHGSMYHPGYHFAIGIKIGEPFAGQIEPYLKSRGISLAQLTWRDLAAQPINCTQQMPTTPPAYLSPMDLHHQT